MPYSSFGTAGMGIQMPRPKPDQTTINLDDPNVHFDYGAEMAEPGSAYRKLYGAWSISGLQSGVGDVPFWDKEKRSIFMHNFDTRKSRRFVPEERSLINDMLVAMAKVAIRDNAAHVLELIVDTAENLGFSIDFDQLSKKSSEKASNTL